jgi:hypothetical protein
MKLWTFKSEQEPDTEIKIQAVTYEGAESKLRFLVIKPELWELEDILKLY